MFLFKRLGFPLASSKKYFTIFYYKIIIMNTCFKKSSIEILKQVFLLCFILNNGPKHTSGKP